ncbi:GNAT family N-acetyltransferase [Demequina aurantiaca]|uniref:GNAT family N-acetyltransferase n=1 Tax=Demequina aurantiaca TaxID=676200 RepID=UPI003D33F6D3
MIRNATPADAVAIAALYDYYVRETVITFELDPVPAEEIARRITSVQELNLPWLVTEEDGEVVGFAYASPYRPRAAYVHSVEVSIYLRHGIQGRGVGGALYRELLARLRELPVHLALSLVALPNDASVALHERLGFTFAGTFTEVGRKFDQWIDVGHWQLPLSHEITS